MGRGIAIGAVLAAAILSASASGADAPTKFSVGGYSVNLLPSRDNIAPTVTFEGRSFMFAYSTGAWRIMDGDVGVRCASDRTNAFVRLEKSAGGVRAEYVHSIYAGAGTNRWLVGFCSNEVVFAEGAINVKATLLPVEPGRYRFRHTWRMVQTVVFNRYAACWAGTTVRLVSRKGGSCMNELTPHDRYDPKAWGLNVNDTGIAREMEFGNVPGIITFRNVSGAGFFCNRYKGGFEAEAVALNDDIMHAPAWDRPFSFAYSVTMQK